MTAPRLELTRAQILGYRQRTGELPERLPPGADSLRRAAWAGLQDSVPRAALHSIHARVAGTAPSTWEDPSLVQVWGPRFSAFVVAAHDRAVFTVGRLPDDGPRRGRAEEMAARLERVLDGRSMPYGEAGRALGVNPNALRYAAPTGTVLIRWDGARQPTVWTVPRPEVDSRDARLELARRYLRVFGPATPAGFAKWAGILPPRARAAFEALAKSLLPVRTPIGEAWILAADEPLFLTPAPPRVGARLLPSGDAYFLLHGADRALLVPDADLRDELWTPRVWPGALLLEGEVAGTWRRVETTVSVRPWRELSGSERDAVEAEARSLPLPDAQRAIEVRWEGRGGGAAEA